jgi:hypothetical protein
MWIVGHFDCHSIIISRNQGIKFLQLLIIWDHTWYNNLYLIVKNPQELVSRKSQSTPELNHDLICKNGVVKKDDPIELLSERVIGREAAGEIPERERERETAMMGEERRRYGSFMGRYQFPITINHQGSIEFELDRATVNEASARAPRVCRQATGLESTGVIRRRAERCGMGGWHPGGIEVHRSQGRTGAP